jgi:DNA-binding XRE family transcriptional regulator
MIICCHTEWDILSSGDSKGGKMTKELALLIDKLKTKQNEAGLSDVKFAQQMHISRQLWSIVEKGKHEPGTKFVKAVISTFPDLEFDTWNYIRNNKGVR